MVALANTSGTLGGYFKYDPYGQRRATIGQDVQHYFLYKGSPDTTFGGIYKYGERYYIASQGRWTQLDPLDHVGDLRQANRYVYVGGDPTNLDDPDGTALPFLAAVVVGTGLRFAGTRLATAGASRLAGSAAGRYIGRGICCAGPSSRVFGYGRGLNTGIIRTGYSRYRGGTASIRVRNQHYDLCAC
jgi:RHS repeat-associated protein